MLTAFFTGRGLALSHDDGQQRATARRRSYVTAIPEPLSKAVTKLNHTQMNEQERRRRTLSDITLETRLRIVRGLAVHLPVRRLVTGPRSPRATSSPSWPTLLPAGISRRGVVAALSGQVLRRRTITASCRDPRSGVATVPRTSK